MEGMILLSGLLPVPCSASLLTLYRTTCAEMASLQWNRLFYIKQKTTKKKCPPDLVPGQSDGGHLLAKAPSYQMIPAFVKLTAPPARRRNMITFHLHFLISHCSSRKAITNFGGLTLFQSN